jgi:hypothetical protein
MTESDVNLELGRAGRVALDYLAGVILALAIFTLPILIAIIATGHGNGAIVAGLVVGCLLTAAAFMRFVRARNEELGVAAALLVRAGLAAWGVAVVAGIVVLSVQASTSKCTGNAAGLAGEIGAIAIYAGAGGWAVAQRRSAAITMLVLPAAALAGLIWTGLAWHYGPAIPGCYND